MGPSPGGYPGRGASNAAARLKLRVGGGQAGPRRLWRPQIFLAPTARVWQCRPATPLLNRDSPVKKVLWRHSEQRVSQRWRNLL